MNFFMNHGLISLNTAPTPQNIFLMIYYYYIINSGGGEWKHQSQLIFCILRLSYKHIDFDSSQGTPCRYTDMGLPELFHFCQAQPKPKPNPQLGAEIALISQLSWTTNHPPTHHPPRIVVLSFSSYPHLFITCSWLVYNLFTSRSLLVHLRSHTSSANLVIIVEHN